jgi:hypothetical protein
VIGPGPLTARARGSQHAFVPRVVAFVLASALGVATPVLADAPPVVLVVESHRPSVDGAEIRRALEAALGRPVVSALGASGAPSITVCVEVARDGSATVLVLGSRALRHSVPAPVPLSALQARLVSSILELVGQFSTDEPLATGLLDWDSRPIYALVESPLLPWPEDEPLAPPARPSNRESAFGLSAPPPGRPTDESSFDQKR